MTFPETMNWQTLNCLVNNTALLMDQSGLPKIKSSINDESGYYFLSVNREAGRALISYDSKNGVKTFIEVKISMITEAELMELYKKDWEG